MRRLYILPGILADWRFFEALTLPFGWEIKVIPHGSAFAGPNLAAYARQVIDLIEEDDYGEVNILGHSFGGVLAQEIATKIIVRRLFLVSTIRHRNELFPWQIRLANGGLLDKMPESFFQWDGIVSRWLLGTEKATQLEKFRLMLMDSNPIFTKWAIKQVLTWQPEHLVPYTIRLHGELDFIIPRPKGLPEDCVIKKAGHLLPMTHPDALVKLIQPCL